MKSVPDVAVVCPPVAVATRTTRPPGGAVFPPPSWAVTVVMAEVPSEIVDGDMLSVTASFSSRHADVDTSKIT